MSWKDYLKQQRARGSLVIWHHQRRVTGRKAAPASLVLRGVGALIQQSRKLASERLAPRVRHCIPFPMAGCALARLKRINSEANSAAFARDSVEVSC